MSRLAFPFSPVPALACQPRQWERQRFGIALQRFRRGRYPNAPQIVLRHFREKTFPLTPTARLSPELLAELPAEDFEKIRAVARRKTVPNTVGNCQQLPTDFVSEIVSGPADSARRETCTTPFITLVVLRFLGKSWDGVATVLKTAMATRHPSLSENHTPPTQCRTTSGTEWNPSLPDAFVKRELLRFHLVSCSNRLNDGLRFRKLSGLDFRKNLLSIHADLKDTAARRNQLQRTNVLFELQKFLRQTDGMRLVISSRAILNCDFETHRLRWSSQ